MTVTFFMARPKQGKEVKVSVTARFQPELISEINDLADSNFGYRSKILEEIVRLGLEEFKRANPKMVDQLKEHKRRHEHLSFKKASNESKGGR